MVSKFKGLAIILLITLFSFLSSIGTYSYADDDEIELLKNRILELEKRDIENRVLIKDLKDTLDQLIKEVQMLKEVIQKQNRVISTIPQRVPPPEQTLKVEDGNSFKLEVEEIQPAKKPASQASPSNSANLKTPQSTKDNTITNGAKPASDETSYPDSSGSSQKKDLYDLAFRYFGAGSYKTAKTKFKEFIDKYPDDDLTDNAQYWIGECYFKEGEYLTAIEEFQKVIEYYPLGNKVPDAYLKIGYSYLYLKDQASALSYFNAVRDMFPHTDASVEAEKKIRELNKR